MKLALVLGLVVFVVAMGVVALAQEEEDDDDHDDDGDDQSEDDDDVTSPQGCMDVCPTYHDPVCAKNSRGDITSFSNACFLSLHNCHNDDDYTPVDDKLCPSPSPE